MDEHGEHDPRAGYDDPDTSPWPILALGVLLALVCFILIARLALTLLSG
jgi:hypothetical protein